MVTEWFSFILSHSKRIIVILNSFVPTTLNDYQYIFHPIIKLSSFVLCNFIISYLYVYHSKVFQTKVMDFVIIVRKKFQLVVLHNCNFVHVIT